MSAMKADATGRSTNTPSRRRDRAANGPPQGEPWFWITLPLYTSDAWRGLSHDAKRIVERLCVEHMQHAGKENGRLPCSYDDFERHGVRRKNIREAIALAENLGFIHRTARGHRSHGSVPAKASRYRLTFLPVLTPDSVNAATNEWARIVREPKPAKKESNASDPPNPNADRLKKLSQARKEAA